MSLTERYDKLITGILSGFLFPFFIGLIIWLFTGHNHDLQSYLKRIADASIITHAITMCVFPNVLIFLLFNRFDMLRASRGVLGITMAWAIVVFIVKFT
jgi:hypothetical protein